VSGSTLSNNKQMLMIVRLISFTLVVFSQADGGLMIRKCPAMKNLCFGRKNAFTTPGGRT
jgi:hypothetical protein